MYVCSALYSQRRSNLPVVAGIFYALSLHIYGFVPPCRCLMARLPSRCSATGKAEPFFISAQQTFSVMHKTSKKCLNGKGISLSDDLKVWRKALTLLPQTKPTQFPSATLRRIDRIFDRGMRMLQTATDQAMEKVESSDENNPKP